MLKDNNIVISNVLDWFTADIVSRLTLEMIEIIVLQANRNNNGAC